MCNSTTFALRHTQISLSGILRHFWPPSRHLLLNTHDTNMEFLQLNGPLLDIFLFFSKTKIFHSHPCVIDYHSTNISTISLFTLWTFFFFIFFKMYVYSIFLRSWGLHKTSFESLICQFASEQMTEVDLPLLVLLIALFRLQDGCRSEDYSFQSE